MLFSGGIIRAEMVKRGYRHHRSEDQLSIRGEYARHLQYVYSKDYQTKFGLVVDLVYFAADVVEEKLVVGIFRENPEIEDGILLNESRAIPLRKFDAGTLDAALDKLIPPVKGRKE